MQKYGFARVEIVQPGDDYRGATLRVLISDDIKILDKQAKVHSQRIRAFDFSTKDFHRVKIQSYADHKINTKAFFYSPKDHFSLDDVGYYDPDDSPESF